MAEENQVQTWTDEEDEYLRQLTDENTPTRVIAMKMQRTEDSIRSHATDIGLSLKPTNQSPMG